MHKKYYSERIVILGLLIATLIFSVGSCAFLRKGKCKKEPDPFLFVPVDEDPKPLNQAKIAYPEEARQAGIEGTVILRVLIDKKGNYVKHIVMSSPHPLLTKAVETHIQKYKFTPAIKDGKPICYWLTMPFKFQLF